MIEAIRRALLTRADPSKAAGMQAYMKSEVPFLGVHKAGRTEVAHAVFGAHPLDGFEAWRDTVLALWHQATYREERYLAIALARDRRYREHRTIAALPLYEVDPDEVEGYCATHELSPLSRREALRKLDRRQPAT